MKVIVTYRNFHDINREEIFPEVFLLKEGETAEEALERIWTDQYNALLAEKLNDDSDPLDENGCWHEEDRAMLTWSDGDTKEFYIVEVEAKEDLTNNKNKAITDSVKEIDFDDAGLLGFVISENIDCYEDAGNSVIGMFNRYPEHAKLLNEMLAAISGYGIDTLKEQMEEQREYYNSL